MFKIINKESLSADITRIEILAPEISRKTKAGQFVMVVADEKGERIPLTLADWDTSKGTITLIFQMIGFSTKKLGSLNTGDPVFHILGPLGHPTETGNFGIVVCIAGGVGIAEIYPVSRAFKETGNRVITILGARSKNLLILEDKIRSVCDELFTVTDDGSYGKKGVVTDILKEHLEVVEKSTHTKYPDLVYAIGPVPMMKAVSELTKNFNVKTIVSVNPIMVDATGMCGACRCKVGGKTVFGCVDGPDFDGHKIDFDELQARLNLFKNQETQIKKQ